MSLGAWGDEDPSEGAFDAAIEAGWIDPTDQTKALIDVMNERSRQVDGEGWTLEHDDQHVNGEIAAAAGAYCASAHRPQLYARIPGHAFAIPLLWPKNWSPDWWKPKGRRDDLVKAGALILAEIERLDRAEKAAVSSAS